MTIYIDMDFKCHVSPAEGLTPIDTAAFDGKCAEYIEGSRFVPAGEVWTREDGEEFQGEMVSPWRNSRELDAAQIAYEQELLARALMPEEIAIAMREGVNSI